ncbi:MAG: pseudouridine synthase [Rhodopseudomonas palustris]|nr:pseudouridine synthase [Rhodopseudomonas palustris]
MRRRFAAEGQRPMIAARPRLDQRAQTAERLGVQVGEQEDAVSLDGKVLHPARRFRYVLLNKPADAVTTVRDDQGRKTVLDLVGEPRGLFPVGRLDLDTEGVLLLTNDGELAYRLAHPRYEIDKLYRAWVPGPFGEDAVKRFRKGVVIEDGFVARGEAQAVSAGRSQDAGRGPDSRGQETPGAGGMFRDPRLHGAAAQPRQFRRSDDPRPGGGRVARPEARGNPDAVQRADGACCA